MINITTNYDDILDILANEEISEFTVENNIDKLDKKKVFYKEKDFAEIVNKKRTLKSREVYHIHGSINDIPNMIISNEDYIERYWTGENNYKKFLKMIFEDYDVLFLGYGLQEFEILNYLFEKRKGPLQKTDKKRLFIIDYFDYEKKKMELLENYYLNNYSVKLCPYSKSEKGFRALVALVDEIDQIKKDEESKVKEKFKALDLLQKNNLTEQEIIELLGKIKNYKDLQSAFLKKIRGDFNYLKYIINKGYFKNSNANVLELLDYLNSLPEIKIDEEILNDIYDVANKNIEKYLNENKFILFIFKFSNKIKSFNLKKLINHDINGDFKRNLINLFFRELKGEESIKFFKSNKNFLVELLCENIFTNDSTLYYPLGGKIIVVE
ncbi:MAG: SIR2 family protein [Clostridium sp.]|uniref:SIR2 family protein n=1 Tax=Clostridium sp. TaxID=1506 RepID=UPI003EE78454